MLSHGEYTTFDDPSAGTGAGQGTNAFGINARGQVVGMYLDSSNVMHSFLCSGAQYTTIGPPNAGPGPNEAVGINSRGQIVGGYTDGSGVTHGYLLRDGQYSTLDYPAATFTFGIGINGRGQIVGQYNDAAGISHGFLLSKGRYTTIDDPNGVQNWGGMINDSGQITGYYLDAAGVYHGFELSDGKYTTLDAPSAGNGAGQGTFLYGINNSGSIVGGYLDSTNLYHGLVATPTKDDSASVAHSPLVNVLPAQITSEAMFGTASNSNRFDGRTSGSTASPLGCAVGRNAASPTVSPGATIGLATHHTARDFLFSMAIRSTLGPDVVDSGLMTPVSTG
jgi:probable HAF family extracellular repeat protein